ncbi:SixA phosphatase family protein [Dermatophilus congolensis]|uniref:SixA phosphatase family protein n=1 Tax=Dermatophilus congolensis TaxID=1863 RepID=UPI001AAF9855|nr:histidine phosphatase family protein [Dermatophilus congolensis]MBO3128770.1 hypothetical protein [Dermatophilus congolensis]MBO3132594.1 hypothetical protein [Dermatophilus congolensis]MBO3133247.1 hypothetical protein [Dermatophilus congolensis]MBO3135481.1 hypothetical protein [Dermatophilus congolensis]MBO3137719.1 hypothetical protein [Dermatophilus congolensis]
MTSVQTVEGPGAMRRRLQQASAAGEHGAAEVDSSLVASSALAGFAGEGEDMRVLVLMRHAKAKSSSPAGDFERPLHRDGRNAARMVGEWLVGENVRPDIAVVSPSARTVQTWEELTRGGLRANDLWADKAIYDGEARDIIESVNALPNDAHVVVVIGHFPGVPQLASRLADHLPAGSAHPEDGWPPASAAVVAHPGSWESFPSEESALVAFRRG